MATGPAPFSDIGKRERDLLYKDYNFVHKFSLSIPNSTGLGLVATGLKKDQIFVGDINSLYKSGNVTVDVKVDTYSNVTTKVTANDVYRCKKVALSFNIPSVVKWRLWRRHGGWRWRILEKPPCAICEGWRLYGGYGGAIWRIFGSPPQTRHPPLTTLNIPDHKSGKLDLQYIHPHAASDFSIGLNPSPQLELSAAIGSKDLCLGAEVGFNTTSASFTKYNAGIAYNKPDFSATLMLADKGQYLKASYIHNVDRPDGLAVAAEITHRLATLENRFTIGSSQSIDPKTVVKTRFSNDGKAAFQCQRAWRPNSLITLSAEYDSTKIFGSPTKFGLALSLKP